ncbi:MAG: RNA-binding S4 domain-containing protein [Burkholderiaceae bacterium]
MEGVRIDKWLWAARFYKTRSLAQTALERGQVLVAGERVKLSRPVREGDELRIRIGGIERKVEVLALSEQRGPASVAQTLYRETPDSITRRVAEIARRALAAEPAHAIAGGRPTKRDRRHLDRWHDGDEQ